MEEEQSAAPRGFLQLKVEKQDSDQSVSEEDQDMDDNSLTGPSGNKGGIGVLSQLELLTDVKRFRHSAHTQNSHLQKQMGLCMEDDVEVPFFESQDGDFISKNDHRMALSGCLDDEFGHFTRMTSASNSEEEIMSDDEVRPSTDANLRRDGKSALPQVSADCKSGVFLNKDAGCSLLYGTSTKSNRSSKAAGKCDKAKPKFLFQSRQQKKDFALVVHDSCETSTPISVLPLNVELDMQRKSIESLDDLLEDFGGNEIQQFEKHLMPSEIAVVHDPNERSMAEFLDHFHQRASYLPQGNSRMQQQTKRRGSRFLRKSNLLVLGDRNMSNADQLEALDSDPSSDEEIPQILKSAIPRRTMADQFHQALGAVSTSERLSIARPKQFGLSGKLQHIMQCEKVRDTDFLEKSQIHDASSDAKSFIDVMILSSSLEAKLTVCFCALRGDEEGYECLSNPQNRKGAGGRKLTIIFSSRICKDVELEIGNLIRIYQPWKEVHVNEKDEAIILCAHFSQI